MKFVSCFLSICPFFLRNDRSLRTPSLSSSRNSFLLLFLKLPPPPPLENPSYSSSQKSLLLFLSKLPLPPPFTTSYCYIPIPPPSTTSYCYSEEIVKGGGGSFLFSRGLGGGRGTDRWGLRGKKPSVPLTAPTQNALLFHPNPTYQYLFLLLLLFPSLPTFLLLPPSLPLPGTFLLDLSHSENKILNK